MSDSRPTKEQREQVVTRAKACCEYCLSQLRFSTDSFSVDHIVPHSVGGTTTLDNLALSCQGCNNHKYNKTTALDPVTGRTVALYHPRQQNWFEHFAWDGELTHIIGLTPTGRATVIALDLNRDGVVNLRRVLRVVDEHPPK